MAIQRKRISIKDVANKAGVSATLVSFVLNGKTSKHRVSDKTAKIILEAAKELNYKPNTAAKTLRDGHSHIIGVVITDIANLFCAHVDKII